MIEVNVILKPHGIESAAKQIGKMTIINDLTNKDRSKLGNYKINIDGKNYYLENWDRSNSFWLLIETAISIS